MHIFVINLARREDRLQAMTAQLEKLGLSFTRVPAIDANEVSDTVLEEQFERSGPLGVVPKGDKCCSLSHREAWKAFLATGEAYAVILEDDVVLDDAAGELLRDSGWLPSAINVLKLEHFGPPGQRVVLGTRLSLASDFKVAPILSRHTGAAAYVLSRAAAQELLITDARWQVPVDHLLFNPNVSDYAVRLRPYQLLPTIARQLDTVKASDIRHWRLQQRKFSLSRLRQQVVRSYYELRLIPKQIALLASGRATLTCVANQRVLNRISPPDSPTPHNSAARPPSPRYLRGPDC